MVCTPLPGSLSLLEDGEGAFIHGQKLTVLHRGTTWSTAIHRSASSEFADEVPKSRLRMNQADLDGLLVRGDVKLCTILVCV